MTPPTDGKRKGSTPSTADNQARSSTKNTLYPFAHMMNQHTPPQIHSPVTAAQKISHTDSPLTSSGRGKESPNRSPIHSGVHKPVPMRALAGTSPENSQYIDYVLNSSVGLAESSCRTSHEGSPLDFSHHLPEVQFFCYTSCVKGNIK